MKKSIGVAIVGGTGYGAGELLRLLTQHPHAEVANVVSSSMPGAQIDRAHPHLSGFYSLAFDGELQLEKLGDFEHKVVFLALPHGASAAVTEKLLPQLAAAKVRLIDLSGDFRLNDAQIRTRYYPEAGKKSEIQKQFVYGLSEINRGAIRTSQLLSTPGCLAAVSILGAAPLLLGRSQNQDGAQPLAEAFVSGALVVDIKTGTSGAGKGLSDSFHHPTRHSNSTPYKVLQHRHEPEVLQALGDPAGERFPLSFVPHLVPTSRGCSATIHVELSRELSSAALSEVFADFYRSHPFVRLRETPPEWQTVVGTNFCDISVVCRGRRAVVMSALDNLVKGTAGQAIQNMNLAAGLPEITGLWAPAIGPATPLP